MEKTPTGSHRGWKHVVYTHPGEGFQSENSSLSSFVTNIAGKLFFWDGLLNTAYCTHRIKGFQFWKQYTLKFCHKFSRKTFLTTLFPMYGKDTKWLTPRRKNVLLRNYLPDNICRKTCNYVTTYRVITYYFNLGTYAPTLMANQPELQFIAGVKPWTTIIFLREEIGGN